MDSFPDQEHKVIVSFSVSTFFVEQSKVTDMAILFQQKKYAELESISYSRHSLSGIYLCNIKDVLRPVILWYNNHIVYKLRIFPEFFYKWSVIKFFILLLVVIRPNSCISLCIYVYRIIRWHIMNSKKANNHSNLLVFKQYLW